MTDINPDRNPQSAWPEKLGLQAALSQLSALVDDLRMGVMIENDARRIEHVNATLCSMFGLESPEALLGMNCGEAAQAAKRLFAHPEDFVTGIEEQLAAHQPRLGVELELADGRWFARDYVPVLQDGVPTQHIWVYRDITEAKRTKQELSESEQRYRAVVEGQTDLICRSRPDHTITFANQAFCRFYDVTCDAVLGENVLSFVHPDDLERVEEHFASLTPDHPAATIDEQVLLASGEVRWLQWIDHALFDQQGRLIGYQSVGRDVTERKRFEKELQRRLAEVLLLNRVIAATASAVRPTQVVETICREVAQAFRVPQVAVAMLNASRTRLTVVAEYCEPSRAPTLGRVIPVQEGAAIKQVLDSRLPVIVHRGRVDPDEPLANDPDRSPGATPLLAVPLIVQGQVVGTLGLDAAGPRAFTEEDVGLIQSVAASTAQSLERARLHHDLRRELGERRRAEEDLRKRDRLLRGVAQASRHLLLAPDWEAGMNRALEALGHAADVDRAYVFKNEIDAASGERLMSQRFEWVAAGVEPQIDNPELQGLSYDRFFSGWYDVLARGEPIMELVRESAPEIRSILGPQSVQSLVVMPIMVEDDFWGFLGFDECRTERHWSEAELSIMATMAGTLGAAIARRRMERALRDSEERYRHLVELSPEAITVHADGEIVFANPAAAELLGYPGPASLIGQKLDAIVHPDFHATMRERHERLQGAGDLAPVMEQRFVRADGSIADVEVLSFPVPYGERRAIQTLVRDVTERKRWEEERLRAQKLESVGVLAGGIAHDFNNILTGIAGNLSLAKMYARSGADLSGFLEEAERVTLRAKGLAEQLLAFSRGGAPIKTTMSISELLRETAAFALRGSKVRCQYSLPPDLWMADIDAGQISQVINNLVINADQAMPEGGVIDIEAANVEIGGGEGLPLDPGRYVRISIRDHGVGIPSEHLSRVFDPYFSTKSTGNGLGLATAHTIVQKHGGHILVESQQGQGTTFHVYLPAAGRSVAPVPAVEMDEPEAATDHGRVLVMDDEEEVRDVAGLALQCFGYEVEYASDGREALARYAEAMEAGQRFDAVIMDLTVPGGMGGKEAIPALLQMDPDARAIVSSGYSNDPVLAEFGTYGFRAVVAKPYALEDLQRTVRAVIQAD